MSNLATSGVDRSSATTERPIIVVSGPGGVGKSTIAHLVAAAFERSVHLKADDFLASVVSGWVDPNLPEAQHQNEAAGGALPVSAMGFAQVGYTAVLSGFLFPDGVAPLATTCGKRGLSCHYAVLAAELDTCWERATARAPGRWPLVFEAFAKAHARFAQLDLDGRHVIDATGQPDAVTEAVLAALRAGKLVVNTSR